MQFQQRQIIHTLPQHWKETTKQFAGNLNNLYIQDHYLIKCNTIYNLEKLNKGLYHGTRNFSKELYQMQLLLKYDKPTCQSYHEKNFDDYGFNWKLMYRIPALLHQKQKSIFSSISSLIMYYLDKNPFHFCIISQSKCSFCELYDETPRHVFYKCAYAQNLWNQLRLYLSKMLHYQF